MFGILTSCLNDLHVSFKYRLVAGLSRDDKPLNPRGIWIHYPIPTVDAAKLVNMASVAARCSFITTEREGKLVIVSQVSGTIEWSLGYNAADGRSLKTTHVIDFSMPFAYKDSLAAVAWTVIKRKAKIPKKVQVATWLARITKAILKCKEYHEIYEKIIELAEAHNISLEKFNGYIDSIEQYLKSQESSLNQQLKQMRQDVLAEQGKVLARVPGDAARFLANLA